MAVKTTKTRTRGTEPKTDDSAERRQRIAEVAYYKAERRGFTPGLEDEDWFEAENEIRSESGDN